MYYILAYAHAAPVIGIVTSPYCIGDDPAKTGFLPGCENSTVSAVCSGGELHPYGFETEPPPICLLYLLIPPPPPPRFYNPPPTPHLLYVSLS